jgi:hypothetical protein
MANIENKINDILKILSSEFDYFYEYRHQGCGQLFSLYSGNEEVCHEWECGYCGTRGEDIKSVQAELVRKRKEIKISNEVKIQIDGILTHEEVAEAIGISPASLTTKQNKKEINIPFLEMTKGKKRYKESDVVEYIEKLFEKAKEEAIKEKRRGI